MRPTVAEIDLSAIRHNIAVIRSAAGSQTSVMAVVKANAYGHGAVPVARTALAAGADRLAVAIPEEGAELRAAGIDAPILVLGLTLPEQADLFAENRLICATAATETVDALAAAAGRSGRRIPVMIKVDTGMGRVGIHPSALPAFAADVAARPGLILTGVFTHLAKADEAEKGHAEGQLKKFRAALATLEAKGISVPVISASNSAAIADLPEARHNCVRPGIILYGLPPSDEMHNRLPVRPAMTLKTRIVFVKDVPAGTSVGYGGTYTTSGPSRLATLPLGYADGYSRSLSNKASVLIAGRRFPVAGRVCMDQIVVDLGDRADIFAGEEAVLFGRQGNEEITVTELAGLAGTINYELVCAVSARVPRIYPGYPQ